VTDRIHIMLDPAEKERFRRLAARQGKTLSAWLRDAARDLAAAAEAREGLETEEELRRFFEACDARESGREPDWEEHEQVIEASKTSGASGT
jgi:Ribbon-helix-helix protein, copG family